MITVSLAFFSLVNFSFTCTGGIVAESHSQEARSEYIASIVYNLENADWHDPQRAKLCLENAACKLYGPALTKLGEHYMHNNSAKGLEYITQGARYGDARACYILGYKYYNGEDTQQDRDKALYWITCAAQLGYGQAQLFLGHYYYTGNNIDRALTWYERAAKQNIPVACYIYACLERDKKNYGIAYHYFSKAAELGYVSAFSDLGACYVVGKGVAIDYTQANLLFSYGMALGDEKAKANYANVQDRKKQADLFYSLLEHAQDPGVRDYCKQALTDLTKMGDIYACWYQAYLFAHGLYGISLDYEKALTLLQSTEHALSRENNHDNIAFGKATETLKKLAEQKNPDSCYMLGKILDHYDREQACEYKKRALEYGSIKAGLELAKKQKDKQCTECNQAIQQILIYYDKALRNAFKIKDYGSIALICREIEKIAQENISGEICLFLLGIEGFYPSLSTVEQFVSRFNSLRERAQKEDQDLKKFGILKDLKLLECKAKLAAADCFLAKLYLTSHDYSDVEKGMFYLKKVLKTESKETVELLTELLEQKYEVLMSEPDLIKYVTHLYGQDNNAATFIMGIWLVLGRPIEQDLHFGIALLKRVAKNMRYQASAYYFIGTALLKTIEPNSLESLTIVDESINYLEKAAELKHPKALLELGSLLMQTVRSKNRDIITQDYAKAINYLQIAAEYGQYEAFNLLGKMYARGQGVPKDFAQALAFFAKAYELGFNEALASIVTTIYEQFDSFKNMPIKKQAQFILYIQAVADTPGHACTLKAQIVLIRAYSHGIGAAQDLSKAAEYALKVLTLKVESDYDLITRLEVVSELLCYLKMRSDHGNIQAYDYLKKIAGLYQVRRFESLIEYTQRDCNQSLYWISLMEIMGCYTYGLGTKQDIEEATRCAIKIMSNTQSLDQLGTQRDIFSKKFNRIISDLMSLLFRKAIDRDTSGDNERASILLKLLSRVIVKIK